VLPAAPSGTVWESPSSQEVSWTMRTNHGLVRELVSLY
jgi:hypothetical protein